MFDKSLGIQIIEVQNGKCIIGDLHIDSKTASVKIKNPLGIESKSISASETQESFKLSLYTLSEFSSGEHVIVSGGNWHMMFAPSKNIIEEYLRINKAVADIREDYNSIDMDKISDNNTYGEYNFKEDFPISSMEEFIKFLSRELNDEENDDFPEKTSWKRKRWLDRLD